MSQLPNDAALSEIERLRQQYASLKGIVRELIELIEGSSRNLVHTLPTRENTEELLKRAKEALKVES